MIGYYLIGGIVFLISSFVSNRLKSKFKHYSKLSLQNGMSGAEIAQKMLKDHSISDVKVISTPGSLTDHYNPTNKTVNLSQSVYAQRNAAAAAVAAHEVGHAIQHAQAYQWLTLRSKIVPAVGIASKFSNIVLMAGLALSATGNALGNGIFLLGILLFGVTTVFTFITLPVEYDASNRALAWLENTSGMLTPQEHDGAKDALKWAARTYLVAALGSLATLMYFVMRYMGNNRD